MHGLFEVIWKSNAKGRPRRSTSSHQMGLMCFYECVCYELMRSLYDKNDFLRNCGQFHDVQRLNFQDVRKLELRHAYVCLDGAQHVWMSCVQLFLVKMMCMVLEFLILIFTLETYGYKFPRVPQEALKKDPKAVKTLPWQCQSMSQVDAPFPKRRPIDGSHRSTIVFLRLVSQRKSYSQQRRSSTMPYRPVDALLMLSVDGCLKLHARNCSLKV